MSKITLQFQIVETLALDLRRSKYDWDSIDEAIKNGDAVKVSIPSAQTLPKFRTLIVDRYKRRGIKIATRSESTDTLIVWPREEPVGGDDA